MGQSVKEKIKKSLEAPSKEARGYTRWWWYGCDAEREEIQRELDEMVKAGIGGVELQILYALDADGEDRKNHFYLSPGFSVPL